MLFLFLFLLLFDNRIPNKHTALTAIVRQLRRLIKSVHVNKFATAYKAHDIEQHIVRYNDVTKSVIANVFVRSTAQSILRVFVRDTA
jgi:hypothetical protein